MKQVIIVLLALLALSCLANGQILDQQWEIPIGHDTRDQVSELFIDSQQNLLIVGITELTEPENCDVHPFVTKMRDGEIIWKTVVDTSKSVFYGRQSALMSDGGVAVFYWDISEPWPCPTRLTKISSGGERAWSISMDDEGSDWDNRDVYLASGNNSLYCLEYTNHDDYPLRLLTYSNQGELIGQDSLYIPDSHLYQEGGTSISVKYYNDNLIIDWRGSNGSQGYSGDLIITYDLSNHQTQVETHGDIEDHQSVCLTTAGDYRYAAYFRNSGYETLITVEKYNLQTQQQEWQENWQPVISDTSNSYIRYWISSLAQTGNWLFAGGLLAADDNEWENICYLAAINNNDGTVVEDYIWTDLTNATDNIVIDMAVDADNNLYVLSRSQEQMPEGYSVKRSYLRKYQLQGASAPENNSPLPQHLILKQNYPNPFNAFTTIEFFLPQTCQVNLDLYSILGQKIMVLSQGLKTTGWHKITLPADQLTSGIYFYRLKSSEQSLTKKLILTK